MTRSASSCLSFAINHRGVSGTKGLPTITMPAKSICNHDGIRQLWAPSMALVAYGTQVPGRAPANQKVLYTPVSMPRYAGCAISLT